MTLRTALAAYFQFGSYGFKASLLTTSQTRGMAAEVFSPATLPCSGRTMANRLVKVALYEHFANMHGGPPNKYHYGLYREWAKHGWGMIITGNVQVSREHLTLGRDMVVPDILDEVTLAPFKKLARVIHAEDLSGPLSATRSLAIMQLSHAGRQSPRFLGGRRLGVPPVAPSSVRLGSNKHIRWNASHLFLRATFQQPRELTFRDIKQVQQAFIRGALTALGAGFDGIQLHCAHGYLLAQFLNPKSNVRKDEYSVESPNTLRVVHEIVEGIRAVVPENFVVGVKINSADYVQSGESPSDARVTEETQRVLDHICAISSWGMVDFIEISGGDYESPDFMSVKETSPRQAFFAQFAQKALEYLRSSEMQPPLVLLTGGLRSPAHLQGALDAGHADLVGIGRGSILCPDLPALIRGRLVDAIARGRSIALDDEPFAHEPDKGCRLPSWAPQIPLLGASANLSWYNVRMRAIAASQFGALIKGKAGPVPLPTSGMTGLEAMARLWIWLGWQELFIAAFAWCVTVFTIIGLMSAM